MTTLKTYTNESYTRTVAQIKNTPTCEVKGWTNTVEVVTVWNDILGTGNGQRTTVERFWTGEDMLDYNNEGVKYYTKYR